jgi:hypothetical protein
MVVEVIVLSTILAASSQRCGVGERVFSAIGNGCGNFITIGRSKEPDLLYSATLEDAIAKDFSLIPDVHFVCVDRADDNLLVWIALDNPNAANREKVFQKQFELLDGFPEVSFDFNVISSQAQNPGDFVSDAKVLFVRA